MSTATIKTWQERCTDAGQSTQLGMSQPVVVQMMLEEIQELRAGISAKRRRTDRPAESSLDSLDDPERGAYGPVLRMAPEGYKLVTEAEFELLSRWAAMYRNLGGIASNQPHEPARIVD